MPAHTHSLKSMSTNGAHTHAPGVSGYNRFGIVKSDKITRYLVGNGGTIRGYVPTTDSTTDNSGWNSGITDSAGGHTHTISLNNTGSGTTYYPLHYSVNVWKRTV